MSTWKVRQNGRVVATPAAEDADAVYFIFATAARAGVVTTLADDAGTVVARQESERAQKFKTRSGRGRKQLSLFG